MQRSDSLHYLNYIVYAARDVTLCVSCACASTMLDVDVNTEHALSLLGRACRGTGNNNTLFCLQTTACMSLFTPIFSCMCVCDHSSIAPQALTTCDVFDASPLRTLAADPEIQLLPVDAPDQPTPPYMPASNGTTK